jgi:small subunit ribosomal protein S20
MEDGLATKFSSAEKRHKQDEKRRVQNKKVKSSVRTASRKVVAAAQSKDKVLAESTLKEMVKQIDTAARKGIVKKNTAARKKSRMQRLVNVLSATSA